MKGLALPVIIVVVAGGVAGLGALAGLGGATVLAALTALFCLLAAFGGPLRADLRLLAGFAPALVFGAGVPRLLGEVSEWAAIGLLTVVVFAAGLLPVLGRRYVTVGLGLGMSSVFGYGFQLTGSASAAQVLGAPALAVGVAIVLRVLAGLRDPGKPVRDALAELLEGTGSVEQAARQWFGDRPRRWTARVLAHTLRYRAARGVLEERGVAVDSVEADRVASLVRARSTSDSSFSAPAPPDDLPGGTREWFTSMWDALGAVHKAATTRDESTVEVPRGLHRRVLDAELRAALSWKSAQTRHAVRVALGMFVALAVARLRPGDPLTLSFLMATFAIMQPEWRDSLSKAWQRIAGSAAGAVVLALVIWLLPPSALLPVGLVAMLAGFPFMTSKPLLFNGCVVLMSVGVNAANRHLYPAPVLVEYLLLILLSAMIGLLFGFAAVPGVRKPSPEERLATAVADTRELLAHLAATLRGDADPRELARLFRRSARSQQDLLATEPGSAEPTAPQRDSLEDTADALRALHTTAVAVALPGRRHAALADPITTLLAGQPTPYTPEDDEQRLLLTSLSTNLAALPRPT
ncbi:FUSC family protein [Amycolatopsis lurida]